MTYKNFNEYLKEIHAQQYFQVAEDERADEFEDWMRYNVMNDEIFNWADKYADIKWKQGRDDLLLLQKLKRESQEEGDESSEELSDVDKYGDFSGASEDNGEGR